MKAIGYTDTKWIRKWKVPSESNGTIYIVSEDAEGNFACSCPNWIYRRNKCKHISKIQVLEGIKEVEVVE